MRRFYSTSSQCGAGCKYCFAQWEDLYASQHIIGIEPLEEKCAIIYPCCDGELFAQKELVETVKKMSVSMNKVYISISTKCGIDDEVFKAILGLDDYLKSNDKGFVKLSVSISTKSMIKEIEPETLPYDSRILYVKKIASAGLATSITLKPVLPFVATEEYYSIVEDCAMATNRLLIGGLYTNPDSDFYQKYIKEKYEIVRRRVSWLPDNPIWDYVDQDDKISAIIAYARKQKMQVFESDADVIISLCNK